MRSTDESVAATDEGFHEIQLSGKQLVFLFMATTVVSVVIFLCGVLVGRGVKAERPSDPVGESVAAAATPDVPGAVPGEAVASPGREPQVVTEELTYPDRLEGDKPPAETLGEAPRTAAKAEKVETKVPPDVDESADSAADSKGTAIPASRALASDGYAVQVAALRDASEADAIVKRLNDKGYPAYVVGPEPGAPAAVYRVRVGKYQQRREVEEIARRLKEEELFKPWITR
ncbi:MAG: SPOR domain-containing protein [Acidobacteria bacterium]|nr:SPOR domain-containing protein [Acidobacteriota bacterium]